MQAAIRRVARQALVIATWTTILAAPSQVDAQAAIVPADVRALYDAAYDRWHAIVRPQYATYDQILSVTRNGRVRTRRSNVTLRYRDHLCRVVGVPLDARDRIDPPMVTDRCFSPDSALTFVPQTREGSGPLPIDIATPAPAAAANTPRTIGHVSTRVRAYEITYVADETVNGIATVHLALRPYREPARYLVRDVWIDRATKGVVRLHGVAAIASHLATIDFIADYSEDANTQIIRHVAGYAKAQLLFVKAGADFTLDLMNDSYPTFVPDAIFNRRGSSKTP